MNSRPLLKRKWSKERQLDGHGAHLFCRRKFFSFIVSFWAIIESCSLRMSIVHQVNRKSDNRKHIIIFKKKVKGRCIGQECAPDDHQPVADFANEHYDKKAVNCEQCVKQPEGSWVSGRNDWVSARAFWESRQVGHSSTRIHKRHVCHQ